MNESMDNYSKVVLMSMSGNVSWMTGARSFPLTVAISGLPPVTFQNATYSLEYESFRIVEALS